MSTFFTHERILSLLKFGLVGGLTVGIDAGVYAILSAMGVDLNVAKAVSFLVGAVFAYFANWRFTFGERKSRYSEIIFVLVYLLALLLNVGMNAATRGLVGETPWGLALAFVVATGLSALWNYAGMSLFVFRNRSIPAVSGQDDDDR